MNFLEEVIKKIRERGVDTNISEAMLIELIVNLIVDNVIEDVKTLEKNIQKETQNN